MAAPAAQGGQPDNSMGILWVIAAIFIFLAFIWYAFKKPMIAFYFKIKLFEIGIISYFTPKLDDVRYTILSNDPRNFTFDNVVLIGNAVGDFLRIPFVVLMIVLACVVYFGNTARVFKRSYGMRDLVQFEKANWPQITPIANLDLLGTDLDKGPWAMALTPIQFCKRNNLIEERKKQFQEGMTHKQRGKIEAVLKRGAATKVFVVQLGPVWPGIEKIPLHMRALFAVFAARINNDSKSAADLLAKMSASSSGKLDFTGTDQLLKKHLNTPLVKEVMNSHAYVLTVLAAMLQAARLDGVQASADFLWLKPVDRRLWYMLNTVGRQTPFAEVAGPFAHWVAEKEYGKKLLVPMVEEATNALEIALKEIIYQPDEKVEEVKVEKAP